MKSTAEQLESVQTAIARIESGAQSYSIDGQTVTRANLAELYKRERELLARYNAEQNGGGFGVYHARFGRSR